MYQGLIEHDFHGYRVAWATVVQVHDEGFGGTDDTDGYVTAMLQDTVTNLLWLHM